MSAEQIIEAGRLWNQHMDSEAIARQMKIDESAIYNRIVAIRAAAMAVRNALWRATA